MADRHFWQCPGGSPEQKQGWLTGTAVPWGVLPEQEQARLHAALSALRILARKYEFKDEEDRAPLASVVDATFPLLLPIFQVA